MGQLAIFNEEPRALAARGDEVSAPGPTDAMVINHRLATRFPAGHTVGGKQMRPPALMAGDLADIILADDMIFATMFEIEKIFQLGGGPDIAVDQRVRTCP